MGICGILFLLTEALTIHSNAAALSYGCCVCTEQLFSIGRAAPLGR